MKGRTDTEILRSVELIIARKADFHRAVLSNVSGKMNEMNTYERRGFEDALARAIASLSPRLFVSSKEAASHMLNPSTRLEDLDRNMLWKELICGLKQLYPETAELLKL